MICIRWFLPFRYSCYFKKYPVEKEVANVYGNSHNAFSVGSALEKAGGDAFKKEVQDLYAKNGSLNTADGMTRLSLTITRHFN